MIDQERWEALGSSILAAGRNGFAQFALLLLIEDLDFAEFGCNTTRFLVFVLGTIRVRQAMIAM